MSCWVQKNAEQADHVLAVLASLPSLVTPPSPSRPLLVPVALKGPHW